MSAKSDVSSLKAAVIFGIQENPGNIRTILGASTIPLDVLEYRRTVLLERGRTLKMHLEDLKSQESNMGVDLEHFKGICMKEMYELFKALMEIDKMIKIKNSKT